MYLSPFFSTSLLPSTTYFVKKWKDPRFCVMSFDGEEEMLDTVKKMGRYLNPMGRKDMRRGYGGGFGAGKMIPHPPQIHARAGKYPIYYIVGVESAKWAIEDGAVTTDIEGNYTPTQQTVSIAIPEGKRICEGKYPNGDPCAEVAEKELLYCKLHLNSKKIAGGLYTAARYKPYLPERLAKLYEESLSRPDLLELENQIAVIDAKIMTTFEESKQYNLPSWEDVLTEVSRLRDPDLGEVAIMNLERYAKDGADRDSKWQQAQGMMEQQRKLVETEVRRKKELNLMIPVDRVMMLMAEISNVIKRHVRDPIVLKQLRREMGALLNANPGTRPSVQIQQGDVITIEAEERAPV